MTDTAQALVIEAVQAGVLLIAEGDRLRFKALSTMPADLAERIRAVKSEVVALVRPPVSGTALIESMADQGFENTAIEPAIAMAPTPACTETFPHTPAATTAGTLDNVATVQEVFPEAQVLDIRSNALASYTCSNPRRQLVVNLLEPIYHTDHDRYVSLRDAWQERIAICTEAGVDNETAEAVALAELRGAMTENNSRISGGKGRP